MRLAPERSRAEQPRRQRFGARINRHEIPGEVAHTLVAARVMAGAIIGTTGCPSQRQSGGEWLAERGAIGERRELGQVESVVIQLETELATMRDVAAHERCHRL